MEIPDPIVRRYRGFSGYLEIQPLAGAISDLPLGLKSPKPMEKAAAPAKGISSLTPNARQPLSLFAVGFRFRVGRKQVSRPLFNVSR